MSDEKKSFWERLSEGGSRFAEAQIARAESLAKASMIQEKEANFSMGKAIVRDQSYNVGSQGYEEKAGSIGYEFQKNMAIRCSPVAAIIKTRQNKAASFCKVAKESDDKGFKIQIKNKAEFEQKVWEEFFPEDLQGFSPEKKKNKDQESTEDSKIIQKADVQGIDELEDNKEEGEQELSKKDKQRIVHEEVERRTKDKIAALQDFILSNGETKGRPFEQSRWNMESTVKALMNDSLTYDQMALEIVPKQAGTPDGKPRVHHFYPVDGATIRFASGELAKYKEDSAMALTSDILYPEEEFELLEARDALELDEERLSNNEYKYVQVIRGRIARAFTQEELCFGTRNPVTDVNSNGYSLSELELLVSLVTAHLNTENYRKAYYQQGFSAKGILHLKANLNRSKLEEFRRHWHHMVRGSKNAFQTPIMSGMDEVQWIPLTQSDGEIEFTFWVNYLIKMICAIYQTDPAEIGYGMKDEGGSGMSGDNTEEKLKNSRDKGFVPLMNFLAKFYNDNIISRLDPDFELVWVGLTDETSQEFLKRQAEEVKFKKTVNEIRMENGLPAIDGADNLILDPVYFQWFMQFSAEGQQLAQNNLLNNQAMNDSNQAIEEINNEEQEQAAEKTEKSLSKALKVEYYSLGGGKDGSGSDFS